MQNDTPADQPELAQPPTGGAVVSTQQTALAAPAPVVTPPPVAARPSTAANFLVVGAILIGCFSVSIAIMAKSIAIGGIGILIAVVASVIGTRVNKKENAAAASAIAAFAARQGLSYSASPAGPLLDGVIRLHPSLHHVVTDQSGSFFIMTVLYESGGPNSMADTLRASVRRVAYAKLQTSFLFIPKQFVPLDIRLTQLFDVTGMEQYSFESAEINEKFICYIQTGSETDALTFLSPDTLVWLETNYSTYPIVLKNGYLYVFGQDLNPQFINVFDYAGQYDATKNVADYLSSKPV